MYDIINKNLDKVTNPKGEEKPSMFWRLGDKSNNQHFSNIIVGFTINKHNLAD